MNYIPISTFPPFNSPAQTPEKQSEIYYIYKCSQTENEDYDTYDSFICIATSSDAARNIHPDRLTGSENPWEIPRSFASWCPSPQAVTVELLGLSKYTTETVPKDKILLSSFNAG